MKKLNARTQMLAAGFVVIALSLAASTSLANTQSSERYPGGTDPSAPAISADPGHSGGGDQNGGGEQPERLVPASVLNPGHRAAGGEEQASSSVEDLIEGFVRLLYGVGIVR